MNKKIKELKNKQKQLFKFASNFLDGFLPENHPFLLNSRKRQKLRIYIAFSYFIVLLILLFVLVVGHYNINVYLILLYIGLVMVFLLINYIIKFKYFEILFSFLILLGISLNCINAFYYQFFPPNNFISLLAMILILHFVYNRWISLFYILSNVIFLFWLLLYKSSAYLDVEIFKKYLSYLYDFVFASLLMWFLLEIYDHFREKLIHINQTREKDLELAAEIQKQFNPLIPKTKKFNIDYIIKPMDQVSGDYIEIIEKDNYYWIFLGDVTGHGLQAGMLTMQTHTLINYLIIEKELEDIKEIFLELNNHYYNILQKLDIKNFATLLLAKVYKNGKIILSGTIQNIFYYQIKINKIQLIEQPSHILGLKYISKKQDINSIEINLNKKDILFFCTDGLVEIFLKNQYVLDKNDFINIMEEYFKNKVHSKESNIQLHQLQNDLLQYLPDSFIKDDFSAILIQYLE